MSSPTLSYRHRNLVDDQLASFLETQVITDLSTTATSGKVILDLSYNRLTDKGLKLVIQFMKEHSEVSPRAAPMHDIHGHAVIILLSFIDFS